MKIMGSEDYYDYVAHIYGVDNQVVLDRRGGRKVIEAFTPTFQIYQPIELAIAGTLYTGVIDKDANILWNDELLSIGAMVSSFHVGRPKVLRIIDRTLNRPIDLDHKIRPTDANDVEDCPILISVMGKRRYHFREREAQWEQFPVSLADLRVPSFLPADDIYKNIYSWILNRRKDGDVDVLTNREKIQARGFDLKDSFRGKN